MSPAPFILSSGLLLGVMLLGMTTALALAMPARYLGPRARWGVAGMAKWVALYPLSALVWAAIGIWVGQLGLPVSSLMPTVTDPSLEAAPTRLAQLIWGWMPPLFLLALPITAQLLATALVGQRPWHRQVRLAGLMAVLLLPVVEDAFNLPGAVAGVIPALHTQAATSWLLTLWPLGALAAGWYVLAHAWPRTPMIPEVTAEDKIREGALIIGLSPFSVWRRHLLRGQLLRGISAIISLAAFGLTGWIAYGAPRYSSLTEQLHASLRLSLDSPLAPLLTSLPFALCALLLWVVARMISLRPR